MHTHHKYGSHNSHLNGLVHRRMSRYLVNRFSRHGRTQWTIFIKNCLTTIIFLKAINMLNAHTIARIHSQAQMRIRLNRKAIELAKEREREIDNDDDDEQRDTPKPKFQTGQQKPR